MRRWAILLVLGTVFAGPVSAQKTVTLQHLTFANFQAVTITTTAGVMRACGSFYLQDSSSVIYSGPLSYCQTLTASQQSSLTTLLDSTIGLTAGANAAYGL